jgi:hypothetical protein
LVGGRTRRQTLKFFLRVSEEPKSQNNESGPEKTDQKKRLSGENIFSGNQPELEKMNPAQSIHTIAFRNWTSGNCKI